MPRLEVPTQPGIAARRGQLYDAESSVLCQRLGIPTTVQVEGKEASLEQALGDAEYLAVCFAASYCPSCKKFMPALEYAYLQGGMEKCKVLLMGGDKSAEAFNAYCAKYPDFLSLSFDETQPVKSALRESWHVTSIPHVVLLDRRTAEVVQSNVRFRIEENPRCNDFPWTNITAVAVSSPPTVETQDMPKHQKHWTLRERLWKRPRFYQMGHQVEPGSSAMYMDENAVRARAGLLHLTSWMAILNMFFWEEKSFFWVLFPVVGWEMLFAAIFGLTPFSPYGFVGTLLAFIFVPGEPIWKPAGPKRFAWIVGLLLVSCCMLGAVLEVRPLMIVPLLMCNAATWAECSLGFCVGCWMWNTIITPLLGKPACQECQV